VTRGDDKQELIKEEVPEVSTSASDQEQPTSRTAVVFSEC